MLSVHRNCDARHRLPVGARIIEYRRTWQRCVFAGGGNIKSNGTLTTKSNGTLALVQSIYDYVHLALWATLAAFVVFFLAFIAPKMPEAAARAEALRVQAISEENEDYCSKWKMGPGTKMHDQ